MILPFDGQNLFLAKQSVRIGILDDRFFIPSDKSRLVFLLRFHILTPWLACSSSTASKPFSVYGLSWDKLPWIEAILSLNSSFCWGDNLVMSTSTSEIGYLEVPSSSPAWFIFGWIDARLESMNSDQWMREKVGVELSIPFGLYAKVSFDFGCAWEKMID